ncbi:protein gar2-like isoform X1 [Zingiber officinale]|uniref:protein gar2-like isoform X1 n=1 Tax=Zingiber officinale TaxID=94328 RepID=UPI001C4C1B28|nr:protein gar2-like isoform X1 [Zingiber officinale]
MPPRRRVVKTAPKTTPKSRTKTVAASESPTTPSADAPALATPPPSAIASETPVSELIQPTPDPPAPDASVLQSPETPAAAVEAVAEPSGTSADANPSIAVAEPQASVSEDPVEAPPRESAEASGSGKKAAVRVRKVIKKKIIKKIVPKVVSLAKKDSASSQSPTETADKETLVTEIGPGNPTSDVAAGDAMLAENNDLGRENDSQRERSDEKKDVHADQDAKDDFAEQQDKENGAQRKQDKKEGHNEAVAAAEDEMAGMPKQQDKENDAQSKQDKEQDYYEAVVSARDEMAGMSDQQDKENDAQMKQDKEEGHIEAVMASADEVAGTSDRKNRRKTEIFIGGLSRIAKEEDLREVFGKVGEIMEVRMMMDGQTGKNKGYAFLRYKDPAQAKKAVSEFPKVEICGKLCGAAALEGNDTIYLGNIDKNWKKEDVLKVLQDIGIENIDTVTVMPDPRNADANRGFVFLELETNRDAHIAYKKLQKKDIFGKGRNISVSWAEPLNDPDDEKLQKVKSVYVEGIPSSWNETKLMEFFGKFGEIERVVHSRNIHSAKRKDFAFVNFTAREAALSCIELFKEDVTENGFKVPIKVSLAKPVQKSKQTKGPSKSTSTNKEKTLPLQREVKTIASSHKRNFFRADNNITGGDRRTSTSNELLQVLREQAHWEHGQGGYGRGHMVQDYPHMTGGKRPFSSLGEDASYSDTRGYPHPRLNRSLPVSSLSHGTYPSGAGPSLPYYPHTHTSYFSAGSHAVPEFRQNFQNQGAPPSGSSMYSRYRYG